VILAETYDNTARSPRRTEDRTATGRLFFGTTEYGCKILNISQGGAQVRLPHSIAIWATVTLVIESIGALHCRVLWQRGETIALQFVQNSNWVNGKFLASAS
jgi:PilZ domain